MRTNFNELSDEIGKMSNAVDSALKLIDTVADEVEANKADESQLALLVQNLRVKRIALAEGVARGTGADETGSETETDNGGEQGGQGGSDAAGNDGGEGEDENSGTRGGEGTDLPGQGFPAA